MKELNGLHSGQFQKFTDREEESIQDDILLLKEAGEELKPRFKMALERNYNVPLRKGFMKAPKYKRAKKAVNTLKEFLKKHMKSDNIKLGKSLNLEIWKHGIKNPPHHIKITAIKGDDGIVKAELQGIEYKEMTKEEKEKEQKKKPKNILKKAEEEIDKNKKEEKADEKKIDKKKEKTKKKETKKEKKDSKKEEKKSQKKTETKSTKKKDKKKKQNK